jgi:hypothetical protein
MPLAARPLGSLSWPSLNKRLEVDMENRQVLKGFAIVVADRGFVYVGDVTSDDQFCVVDNAKNVRKWGTTKGLGQLALEGPTSDTVLDAVGTVRIPARAVISIIDSEAAKWPASR